MGSQASYIRFTFRFQHIVIIVTFSWTLCTFPDRSGRVSILGFYLVSGPMDNAIAWMQLTKQERDAVKADYAAAGISLMISAFGSTETPTTCAFFFHAYAQAAVE